MTVLLNFKTHLYNGITINGIIRRIIRQRQEKKLLCLGQSQQTLRLAVWVLEWSRRRRWGSQGKEIVHSSILMLDINTFWLREYDRLWNICLYRAGCLIRWRSCCFSILYSSWICIRHDRLSLCGIWIEISKIRVIVLLQLHVLRWRYSVDRCMEP